MSTALHERMMNYLTTPTQSSSPAYLKQVVSLYTNLSDYVNQDVQAYAKTFYEATHSDMPATLDFEARLKAARFIAHKAAHKAKHDKLTLLGLKAAFSSGKVSEAYKTRYAPIIARFSHGDGTMTMNKIASCQYLPIQGCECLPYHTCEYHPMMTSALRNELLGRGLIVSDDGIRVVARIKPIDVDTVRPQNPTHKPDGKSQANTLTWLTKPALAKKYKAIGTRHVKRGGVETQTVYNIIGKRDNFYLLRCPVTGGTIGRLISELEIPN